jgi:uncharacterized protein (TIGR02996 family)
MDSDCLLSAILEFPHDDEPRLAYAEWLDDRDNPRGELIRLQCHLERIALSDPLRLVLETRERELLGDHEDEWLGQLAPLVDWAVFRRGFADEIAVSAKVFIEHAETIFRLAPIRQVHLRGAERRMVELAGLAQLRRVTHLDLSDNFLRDPGVRTLASSPYLNHLEGLNLSSTGVGDGGACGLASARSLTGIRELYLCDNRIGRRGLRALAKAPFLSQLEVLSLRHNAVNTEGRDLLPADPVLCVHL